MEKAYFHYWNKYVLPPNPRCHPKDVMYQHMNDY